MIPERTLEELGWPEIGAALAARCRTLAGARLARALPFLDGADAVAASLARIAEARDLAQQRATLPLSGFGEVEGHLDRAAKGGLLDGLALRELAALERAAARTYMFVLAHSGPCPLLWRLAEPLSDSTSFADEVERCFEPSGELSERASPRLAELRERARGLHRALKQKVEGLLADPGMQRSLRDAYFTIRNERYVLPILASARGEVPGIVHNASQSGQTLFVEPEPLIGLGNDLSIASAMALEEEQRVLRDLSDRAQERSAGLASDLAVLARLDLVAAQAQLAADLDAHAPEIVAQEEGFALRSLRHPLLVLARADSALHVVASDLRLVPPQRALVVSGPNAGGKTVAITAVGLSAVMLRAGLPVPAAEGSKLPLYLDVRAAIEERGDLHRDLSTFTAHLAAIREIVAEARPGALVLVDEIAADTDPREGAALAAAILEDLVQRGAQVLVTTHLDELKALGLGNEAFANARVGFDPEKLTPTYQVILGTPGGSSAIEVARRVGLPKHIVERARASLAEGDGALGAALRKLDEARDALSRERADLERARLQAEEAQRKAEARAEAAARAEKEAESRARAELAGELGRMRDEAAKVLATLQHAPTVRKATEAAARLDALRAGAEHGAKAAGEVAKAGEAAVPGGRVEPGARVKIVSLGQEGEVLELDGRQALVRAGALKVRRPVDDLLPLRGKPPPAPAFARGKEERLAEAEAAAPAPVTAPGRALDVRGLRVEELLREVERFLDALYAEGAADATILHGHGTGALKQALRDYLGASPYVADFRAGDRHEGGDAVTLVKLRH